MTTAVPAVSPSEDGADVCRLTVEGPAGRVDLAVPTSLPIAALIPVVLRSLVADPDQFGAHWLLQRLGEEPLNGEGTPQSLDLRHGDVLHLRPVEAPMPGLHFDDIADGVAHATGQRSDRWRPDLTRRLLLGVALLALATLAWDVLHSGAGWLAAVWCGVSAVVLVAGALLAPRRAASEGSAVVAGVGGYVFAALTGLTIGRASHAGHHVGLAALLLAGTCAALVALVMLVTRRLPLVVSMTMLVTAVVAGVEAVVGVALGRDAVRTATVVAVALYVLGHFGPRLALRTARLRVPQLPHNVAELQQDIAPLPDEVVTRRVTAANAHLTALSLTSSVAFAIAFWLLAHDREWIGWVLTVVLGIAVLMRARELTSAWQRIPAAVAGALGLALVLSVRVAPDRTLLWSGAVCVLLAAVGLLLVAAWRLPTGRLLPVWGQLGDTVQMITVIALLPLTCQVLHVYGYFRSLAG
jgi:type VII secretion integral membrane protein EccD